MLESLFKRATQILKENTIVFDGRRIVIPHPKRFPIPYCWDSAFHILALNQIDLSLSKENIECLLSLVDTYGMIPNAPSSKADQDLRSQPPIIFHAVWDYWIKTQDSQFLQKCYASLKKYYEWWNRFGCLEKPFISPFTGVRQKSHLTACWAVCSTGMDNHALYDFCGGKTLERDGWHYIPCKDVILSCSHAHAAKIMADMAEILGLKDDESHFRTEFNSRIQAICKHLWNPEDNFIYPAMLNGRPIKVKSIQAFTALYAQVLTKSKVAKLIEHLTMQDEFWSEYGIPTIALNDPKYMTPQPNWLYSPDPYYWRGTIWAPTTMLTYIGLKNYGYENLAIELAEKWTKLIDKTRVFAEYYYSDGRPGATNLKNFSWTAAATIFLTKDAGFI